MRVSLHSKAFVHIHPPTATQTSKRTDFFTAKLEALAIQGIRSFDNTREETIRFNTPLTLIVGYNGSGKTTIIECLKYATSGIMPPNSAKGGAFIHDPKLAGEREVLAMVKLSFKVPNGARAVVSRRLQLTVNKGKNPTMKTIEGTLKFFKNGERSVISSKMSELDTLVPQYLGPSKAVLDSVIFCHQDDSLWPMSEPKKLKEKFDHIFEALKYTKALENLKALRKNQATILTTEENNERHYKENKIRADQNARRSDEVYKQIEQLREEATELDKEAKEAAAKSEEALTKASRYERDAETLKSKREGREMLQGFINTLANGLEERTESDDWLQTELDHYSERMAAHDQQRQRQTNAYNRLKENVDSTQDCLDGKLKEKGRYDADKESHDQLVRNRSRLIREKASHHNIQGFDHDLDDEAMKLFMKRISKLSQDKNSLVEKARQETEDEMQQVHQALEELRDKKSSLLQSKKSTQERILANNTKIDSCRSSLKKLDIDEGRTALIESTIQNLVSQLRIAKDEFQAVAWDSELLKADSQLRLSNDKQKLLNEDLAHVTAKARELARLDHLQKELGNSSKSLDAMRGAHRERLEKLIGPEWSPSSLLARYQSVLRTRENEVKEITILRDGMVMKRGQVDVKLTSLRADLKKGEKEQEKCVQDIANKANTDPEDYTNVLRDCQADRDVAKSDADTFAAQSQIYKNCISTANDRNCCRTCRRGFDSPDEKAVFVQRLEGLLKKEQVDYDKNFKVCDEELARVKDASSSHTTWTRLHDIELPRIRGDIKRFESERNELVDQIEAHDRIVLEKEQSKADTDTLSEPVKRIHDYNQQVQKFQSESQELAAKQKDAGLSRTMEDIQGELRSVDEKSDKIRASIAKLKEDRDAARSRVKDLELELSTNKNKLMTSNHDLEKKTDLERQINELQCNNGDAQEAAKRLDAQVTELKPLIDWEETKLADAKSRGLEKEKTSQGIATRLSDSVRQLETINQQIRAYVDEGGPAKLAGCNREVERLRQEKKQLQDEMTEVAKDINKISKELQSHETRKRNIEENIKYRSSQRQLEDVKADIARLETANAEADLRHHRQVHEKYELKRAKCRGDAERKQAQMAARDDQLQQLIDEFNQFYTDAGAKYRKSHIIVETTKAAMEDLKRYADALDKAIMKYHGMKMEEINQIIGELWRKTYQGTDVDTILIRSENEKDSAKTNRSYNYRVSMVKSDVEMDMRGRCSAGQKVLASIIIRLALAECFGTNCGLLALDEPTTNLDRDNIRALAESLHDIIRDRKQQANFQLIVITHDEEFLKFMQCADFCDDYYRISRDNREKSTIKKQSISMVV